jgi:hypothetical protein
VQQASLHGKQELHEHVVADSPTGANAVTVTALRACSRMIESIIKINTEIETEIDKGCSTMSISNTVSVVDQIDTRRSMPFEIQTEIDNLNYNNVMLHPKPSRQTRDRDKKHSYRNSYSTYLQTAIFGEGKI